MASDTGNEPESGSARAGQLRRPKLMDVRARGPGVSQSVTLPWVSFVTPVLTEATNVNTVPDGTVTPDAREFVPAAMARSVVVGTNPGAAIAL
jgi:hypothetical protein